MRAPLGLASTVHLHGLDMNLVLALHALLQQRNVTRAARAVGLSQSSMSHALSRLRAHFGDPLLLRAGRELVLTERAKSLAGPVASAVIELKRVFLEPVAFDPATSDRLFQIAAPDNLGLYLLPRLVASLARTAPNVALRVVAITDDWPARLLRGDLDLKLGRSSAMPANRIGLRSEELFEEEFACVVRRRHPLAGKRVTIGQYADLRHLVIQPGPSELLETHVDRILARHGKTRRVALHVPHFVLAPFVVDATDVALTAAQRLLAPFERLLKLRRLVLPFELPSYRLNQVWAHHMEHDPAHAWLRGEIRRAAADPRSI